MAQATAELNTYRQSPRKVRLLADLVRGKSVSQAITTLRFASKRATGPIIKLLESAVANAKNTGLNTESLVVKNITVNAGQILHRSLPMSRGRAFRIKKRTSHIAVLLSERTEPAQTGSVSEEKVKKAEPKKVKKTK